MADTSFDAVQWTNQTLAAAWRERFPSSSLGVVGAPAPAPGPAPAPDPGPDNAQWLTYFNYVNIALVEVNYALMIVYGQLRPKADPNTQKQYDLIFTGLNNTIVELNLATNNLITQIKNGSPVPVTPPTITIPKITVGNTPNTFATALSMASGLLEGILTVLPTTKPWPIVGQYVNAFVSATQDVQSLYNTLYPPAPAQAG